MAKKKKAARKSSPVRKKHAATRPSSSSVECHTSAVQWLKAMGRMRGVELADLGRASIDVTDKLQFLEGRFCGVPDHGDAEVAASDRAALADYLDMPEDFCSDLQQMHSRLVQQATGSGSWPARCHLEHYPEHHALTFFLDRSTFPRQYTREVRVDEWEDLVEAKVWGVTSVEDCVKKFVYRTEEHAESAKARVGQTMSMLDVAYTLVQIGSARVGCAMVEVFTGPSGRHNVHIVSKPIPGSVIGYAYFPDGTCGDHVMQVIDSTWVAGLHPVAGLGQHESGHNLRLYHEFAGQSRHHSIMSYSQRYPFQGYSTGQPPYREMRDASWPELTDFFGGQPVPFDPFGDDPVKPPQLVLPGSLRAERISGNRIAIRGTIGPVQGTFDGQNFHARPDPDERDSYVLVPETEL